METQDRAPQNLTTRGNTIALVTSSLAAFMTTFMSSSINVAIPDISREFQSNAVLIGWIATAFLLSSCVFLVPFGRIADIIGIKKIFLIGVVIFTLGALMCMFSSSTEMLIGFRALQGLGGAMIFGNSMALVTATHPAKERGKVLGINVASVYIGLSLGPFFGGLLTEHFGWRSIFLTNLPVGLSVIFLLLWKVKGEWCASKGEKFDYSGSIIYGLALISLIYGFSTLPEVLGFILTALGVGGLWLFLAWESRVKSPVLNIGLFRHNKPFIFSNLAALINYCATFAVIFLMSLYLQYIKGFSPEQAGFILIAQPIMQAILSPFTGRLSDRIDPGIVASIGMGLTFVGQLIFVFLTESTSIVQIILVLILLGIGFGIFSSPNSNAIMSSIAPRYYGVGSATMNTMRTIGQMFSMGISMIVLAVFVGRVVITPEYHAVLLISIRVAFAIFTVICAAGIFASLSRGKVRRENP